jgi:RNA-directed DNA polymerase
MTAVAQPLTGALSSAASWSSINWENIKAEVNRLQMRIAKAIREGRRGKVKALQRLLTHSFNAKLLAIKRVTENSGKKTPGVDGIIWKNIKRHIKIKGEANPFDPTFKSYFAKRDKRNKINPRDAGQDERYLPIF